MSVEFTGDNYAEIMNFTRGLAYVTCKYKLKFMLRIPLVGTVEIRKGNKIYKESNKFVIKK